MIVKKINQWFEQFTHWLIEKNQGIEANKVDRIYSALLLSVFFLSMLAGGLASLTGARIISLVTLSVIPTTGLSILFTRSGKKNLGKSLVLIYCNGIILTQAILYQNVTHVSLFFTTLMICSLILYQGKERYFGRTLAFFSFGLMMITEIGLLPDLGLRMSATEMKIDLIMNVIGASVLSYICIYFMLKFNDSVQNTLKIQTEEYERMNQHLIASNNTKTRLFSIISHDLRNPLIAMKASLSAMREPDFPEGDKAMLFEELDKRADYAMNLMNNLLIWSRTQLNGIQFQPEILEMGELSKMVMNQLEALASEKRVSLMLNYSGLPVLVKADKNMLEIVVRNLISNAIKFTLPGGFVKLHGTVSENKFALTVADSGIGIDNEALEKIRNQVFYTTPGTNREKGSGLGLMLCREFLSRHNSDLNIDSAPGSGTRISFQLELADH